MLKKLKLKFGSAPSSQALEVDLTPVTIFIGPNNSGKSKLLAEIKNYVEQDQKVKQSVVLEDIELSGKKDIGQVSEIINDLMSGINQMASGGLITIGAPQKRTFNIQKAELEKSLLDSNVNPRVYCQYYLQFRMLNLDGKTRLGLVDKGKAGNLQIPPKTSADSLFRNDVERLKLRKIIHEALGIYFCIDPTDLGFLKVSFSSRAPRNPKEERGLHDDAVSFFKNASDASQVSDGVKAFTGVLMEIIAGDPELILIDEPEAFLHPSLSFKLGKEIALNGKGSSKNIFISTHSQDFLRGCIQAGIPINIIRLTYKNKVPTARLMSNESLAYFMQSPLLRSAGVVSALFYESVIVTESDSDRVFYQEINERILQFKPQWGIQNCLFINAQNKQTVSEILKLLRQLGIPSAGIVDVDFIKDKGKPFQKFMDSLFIPELQHDTMSTSRSKIWSLVQIIQKDNQKDLKRDGGVNILSDSDREAAMNFINEFAKYGLFIIPGGELECWLKHLGASGHGSKWIPNIFEKMGDDPDSSNYVRPSDDDVWAFIKNIRDWLYDPNRKGIPK